MVRADIVGVVEPEARDLRQRLSLERDRGDADIESAEAIRSDQNAAARPAANNYRAPCRDNAAAVREFPYPSGYSQT